MTVLNHRQIMQRVFTRGSNISWANFLKSLEVAERVAADVRRHLQANGIDVSRQPHLVVAKAGDRWEGTFSVEVRLPGIRSFDARMKPFHDVERDKAIAALRASVRPGDIVTSWTMPR